MSMQPPADPNWTDPDRISAHHVGGRDGLMTTFGDVDRFGLVPAVFSPDFSVVLYDADEDCVPQMEVMSKNYPVQIQVVPACLGDHSGPETFYINYDPFSSSLLRLN